MRKGLARDDSALSMKYAATTSAAEKSSGVRRLMKVAAIATASRLTRLFRGCCGRPERRAHGALTAGLLAHCSARCDSDFSAGNRRPASARWGRCSGVQRNLFVQPPFAPRCSQGAVGANRGPSPFQLSVASHAVFYIALHDPGAGPICLNGAPGTGLRARYLR